MKAPKAAKLVVVVAVVLEVELAFIFRVMLPLSAVFTCWEASDLPVTQSV